MPRPLMTSTTASQELRRRRNRERARIRLQNETQEQRSHRLALARESARRYRQLRAAQNRVNNNSQENLNNNNNNVEIQIVDNMHDGRINSNGLNLGPDADNQNIDVLDDEFIPEMGREEIYDENGDQQQELLGNIRNYHFSMVAFNYTVSIDYGADRRLSIGRIDKECRFCKALRFESEPVGICCSAGKIHLTPIDQPGDRISQYYDGQNSLSKEFLKKIRSFNSCFQMTSFGATRNLTEPGWMTTFKIQGQVYHLAGSLLPQGSTVPSFLQLYFIGASEYEFRCQTYHDLRPDIIHDFMTYLHNNNQLILAFKYQLERTPARTGQIIIRADRVPEGEHPRRFNAPTTDECAAIIVDGQSNSRDIIITTKSNNLVRISEIHPDYDALQYPLMFLTGQQQYSIELRQLDPRSGHETTKRLSPSQYYRYRMMIRSNSVNLLLRCGNLFSQYIVDMYAKIEAQRLKFLLCNQEKLRVEQYEAFHDAMMSDGNPEDIGKRIILPSSFTGSPRHMHEYTQDAMSYVRKFGRPDLFITFTCNPNWIEIKENLMSGQSASERHDIVARVFKAKLYVLKQLITKKQVFGKINCYMYTIEWQKRGLPHSHMLVWLTNRIHPDSIDMIISAEIPDPSIDPALFEIITKHMVHNPCGSLNPSASCMVNGVCSRKYPRNFMSETMHGQDGYPTYRRRKPEDGGRLFNQQTGRRFTIDNRWIVPYNSYLSKVFNTHINVEYCGSIQSIKYVCKYINKGSDLAQFETRNVSANDEVTNYQLGRYISSSEACWRVLDFSIHERSPTVVHLAIHLENCQSVFFTTDNAASRLNQPPRTTLTAFFSLCAQDEFAKTLLYQDVPQYFVWNKDKKIFTRRKRGDSNAIGRIYTVHPNRRELYFLRLLLVNKRGPTSFEDLRTVNDIICDTYHQACVEMNLLESDFHWEKTLEEAELCRSPSKLRELFSIIISICSPTDPKKLWERFREGMSEDYLYEIQRQDLNITDEIRSRLYNKALIVIDSFCFSICGQDVGSLGLDRPIHEDGTIQTDLLREMSYDTDALAAYFDTNFNLMNPEQRSFFNQIISMIDTGGVIFLDAPGGTGKTFLLNLILARVRLDKLVAIAVASSGIAATLLDGGRTAHSIFKLPLEINSWSTPACDIGKQSGRADLLRKCKLIVWDECVMSHKRSVEAVDRLLRDLNSKDTLFGGTLLLLAGDFRQILPVVPRGTPADEIDACLKSSPIWNSVVRLSLTTNMRALMSGDPTTQIFAQYLLTIGNGTHPTLDCSVNKIKLDNNLCHHVASRQELIDKVFPELLTNYKDLNWLSERAILAPTNDIADSMNTEIAERIPGQSRIFISVNTMVDSSEAVLYPTEFLNSIEDPGMPAHLIKIKVGVPIMILRNLKPPMLCNGTRLVVKSFQHNLIEATIIVGKYKGHEVFIPRIPMISSSFPFKFKRLQFPIRLSFAMTINKSQGQSMRVAGINLERSCFTHGQLYVACSRVGCCKNLFVFLLELATRNVVYYPVLR